jgi:hypothetical protein
MPEAIPQSKQRDCRAGLRPLAMTFLTEVALATGDYLLLL